MANAGVKLTDRPGSKIEIAEVVFGRRPCNDEMRAYQPYFDYYISELQLLHRGIAQETQQVATLATQEYEDIFHVIDVLRKNTKSTRPQLRDILLIKFRAANTLQLDRSINLAIRLWLMVNVQDAEFETLRQGATCIAWNDHTSLQDFLKSLFSTAVLGLNVAANQFSPYFTAAFMCNVCGLKTEWTTSLHDHLRVDRSKNSIKIFAYKCHIAELLAQFKDDESSPIPRTVLRETLLSLELLFPLWDNATIKLLEREQQTFHMNAPFMARPMTLRDFDHWRDRLLELQDILQSPPVSWAQLWKDRRSPQQFWTFWIALMILVLTIISTITGIVQAWASVQSLKKG